MLRLRVVLHQGPQHAGTHGLGPAKSLRDLYRIYHAYKWIWPGDLPEEAPISTCLEFYRRALERRRDYQHRWWRSGLPFFLLLGMVMAGLGTGARNAALQHPLLNALPFFLILAVWAVAFLLMRKKLGRENLQQEIEELRAFELLSGGKPR
jgi:hypothetical protein